MTLRRRVRTLARLPARDQVTLLRVLMLTGVVEVLLRTTPLPRVAALLGVVVGDRDAEPGPPLEGQWLSLSELRGVRCTNIVLRRWALADGPCLRRALVAGHVLRRHRPVLCIGVARNPEGVTAHAWLDVRGRSLGAADGFLTLSAAAAGSASTVNTSGKS